MTHPTDQGSIVSTRPDFLIFTFRQDLTKPEIRQMADDVARAMDRFDQIDILVIIRDYRSLEFGAVFDAKALATQIRSAAHVRRYAVVGAPAFAKAMIETMAPISPVDARTFEEGEEQQAFHWASTGADIRYS
jgi:hypothetical protein